MFPEGAATPTDFATGLSPARLTMTVGVGARVFELPGLTRESPRRLRPLPAFTGDHLDPRWGGGDLIVQICPVRRSSGGPGPASSAPRATAGRRATCSGRRTAPPTPVPVPPSSPTPSGRSRTSLAGSPQARTWSHAPGTRTTITAGTASSTWACCAAPTATTPTASSSPPGSAVVAILPGFGEAGYIGDTLL